MTERMEIRMQEIRRRTAMKRCQRDRREVSLLSMLTLLLMAGIRGLYGQIQTSGYAVVTGGYSSMLVREGAGLYVIIGIIAFVLGAGITVLSIRLKRKWTEREDKKS